MTLKLGSLSKLSPLKLSLSSLLLSLLVPSIYFFLSYIIILRVEKKKRREKFCMVRDFFFIFEIG